MTRQTSGINAEGPEIRAAKQLLQGQRKRPEDNIRQDLGRLLDTMEVENILTYATPAGPADLYLPRRRTIIECKRIGDADDPEKPQARESNETPREQLERYILAEIQKELELLDLEGLNKRSWIGIVTDGHVWHAWRYAHQSGSIGQQIFSGFRPNSPKQLIIKLRKILSEEPLGKPWIPEKPAALFKRYREDLTKIRSSLKGKREKRTQTKQQLWLDVLRTSSMAPSNDAQIHGLFIAHSFLITLARGVVHTLSRQDERPNPEKILKEGFAAWIIDSTEGRSWAQEILDEVHSYEWRRRSGDVLRSVYEAFISDTDRKIFGEYYTPDWLAAVLVEEVCDEAWCNQATAEALAAEQGGQALKKRGVLDPACGSGTFLYHAAKRILRCQTMQEDALGSQRKAGAVARVVCGLDIHPVAVEIARATLMRALPAPPLDHEAAIRVHQGDALMAQPNTDNALFTHTKDTLRFETPQGREIHLPKSFAHHRQFGANLRRLVEAAKESNPVPADILATTPKEDQDALQACRKQIEKIILTEGNSVWAWYMANITAPLRLSERKVDRIVANPPWVTMAEVQVEERKQTLESFSKRIGLWDGGKQAPHHDIAQLFVKRCREQYLADPATNPAAWLVKKAVLTGGHWAKFREWYKEIGVQTLDLEKIRPFGGGDARRCCALFDKRACTNLTVHTSQLLIAETTKKMKAGMSIRDARKLLRISPAREMSAKEPSAYADGRFRQGASIVPAVLTKIEYDEHIAMMANQEDEVEVTTIQSAKDPWKKIHPLMGSIPRRWVRTLYTSNELLAFWVRTSTRHAIIPVDEKGNLERDPKRDNNLWRQCEELYEEYRSEGRYNPKTLRDRIDYGASLSKQLRVVTDVTRQTVLYPKASDIMRAGRIARGNAITNDTLYYWEAESEEEAAYLVAILNAPALREAFKESKQSGRHIDTHFWRKIPIPRYEQGNSDHAALARLANEAETNIKKWISDPTNTKALQQVGLSARIRTLLDEAGILRQIDTYTTKILPKHSSKRRQTTNQKTSK